MVLKNLFFTLSWVNLCKTIKFISSKRLSTFDYLFCSWIEWWELNFIISRSCYRYIKLWLFYKSFKIVSKSIIKNRNRLRNLFSWGKFWHYIPICTYLIFMDFGDPLDTWQGFSFSLFFFFYMTISISISVSINTFTFKCIITRVI